MAILDETSFEKLGKQMNDKRREYMRELQRKKRASMSADDLERRREKDKARYYDDLENERKRGIEKYYRLNYGETKKEYRSDYAKEYMPSYRLALTKEKIEQRKLSDKERYVRLNGKEYASKKKYKEYWECHRLAVQIRKES